MSGLKSGITKCRQSSAHCAYGYSLWTCEIVERNREGLSYWKLRANKSKIELKLSCSSMLTDIARVAEVLPLCCQVLIVGHGPLEEKKNLSIQALAKQVSGDGPNVHSATFKFLATFTFD